MWAIDFRGLVIVGIFIGLALAGIGVGLFFLCRWIFNHLQWV